MRFDPFDSAVIDHFHAPRRASGAAQRVLSPEAFAAAQAEIASWAGYAVTPLHPLPALAESLRLGAVLYKDEGPRFGLGSFKALGAAYAALRVLQAALGKRLGRSVTLAEIRSGALRAEAAQVTLCSATDGNHGRSLAWGCQRFGAGCRIYIHAEVSEARAQVMRDFGADVCRIAGNYDASVAAARDDAQRHGWFMVADTSWPGYTEPPRDVMAGYGTMVSEACAAMDRAPTHVFVQGGVGGLAASVAACLRQNWGDAAPRVIVVEPALAPCLRASAQAGRATAVDITAETIMAGLSCGEPSPLAWEVLVEEASDYLAIPDALIGPTMRLLARPLGADPQIEGGESGVAGLAALIAAARQPGLRERLGLTGESRVLLFGSEGITDPEIYAAMMAEAD
ncbi:diaminopropionate ammonia-lyase [Pseudorhodobacter sp. E13]|uniref:diaminopropionate ammonia-lyase n=1 Tax=Pseudorhodobacter sp. E13 TaxID=2487931 RepID=UPI000F8E8988|nr:diaminopropionate ammonia-lyase [Pseudorhodobacter sp. E13]RUS59310.1 diaminopropionate ammonia-lyase [Pseudorhodobacter sp. E13]